MEPSHFAPGTAPGTRPCILLGLIGCGIGRSRTPAMHEGEAEAQGLRLCYRLFDGDRLGIAAANLRDWLVWLARADYRGVNITYPFKQTVLPQLDRLSPEAAALGSVNTVLFEPGRFVGHNTDWSGFARGFERAMPQAPRRRVVQLGAGGAGTAVGYALLGLGVAELVLVERDPDRAAAAAARLRAAFPGHRVEVARSAAEALAGADGLVNTTPVGMAGHPGIPVEPDLLHPDLWVVDIVYVPRTTELLAAARARGCTTLDGAAMAIFQAVDAFRLFTGREADAARMAAIFEALGEAESAPQAPAAKQIGS